MKYPFCGFVLLVPIVVWKQYLIAPTPSRKTMKKKKGIKKMINWRKRIAHRLDHLLFIPLQPVATLRNQNALLHPLTFICFIILPTIYTHPETIPTDDTRMMRPRLWEDIERLWSKAGYHQDEEDGTIYRGVFDWNYHSFWSIIIGSPAMLLMLRHFK